MKTIVVSVLVEKSVSGIEHLKGVGALEYSEHGELLCEHHWKTGKQFVDNYDKFFALVNGQSMLVFHAFDVMKNLRKLSKKEIEPAEIVSLCDTAYAPVFQFSQTLSWKQVKNLPVPDHAEGVLRDAYSVKAFSDYLDEQEGRHRYFLNEYGMECDGEGAAPAVPDVDLDEGAEPEIYFQP